VVGLRVLSTAWECPDEPYGGLGVFLTHFLPEVAKDFDVVHYCLHGTSHPLKPQVFRGVRVVRLHEPPIDRGGGVLNLANAVLGSALLSVIPAFDVLLAHDVHSSTAVVVAGEVGVRTGYYVHMFTASPTDIAAVAYADVVMANSRLTASQIRGSVVRDVRVVYPASPYPPASEPVRNDNEVPVVAIPSRFQFNKSPTHVVRALEEVRRRVRFRVVVFGRGAEYYSLPPWVENAGTVSEEVKVRLIKSSDLVLQVGFPEPFGLVPLEAVALGVPALVSRASGAAEVFPEEAVYTPEDLPEKLTQLLGDRGVREGLWFRERESPIMRRSWRDVWAEVREAVGIG